MSSEQETYCHTQSEDPLYTYRCMLMFREKERKRR